jgi:hypothetical protein
MRLLWAGTVDHSSVIMHKCLPERKICRWTSAHISVLSDRLFRRIISNCRLFKLKNYLFFLRNERFRFHYLLLNIRSYNLNWRDLLCLLLFNYRFFFDDYLYGRWLYYRHFFRSPFPPATLYFLNIFEIRIETLLHFPCLLFIFIILRVLFFSLLIVTLLRVHVSLILKLIVIGPSPIIHGLCCRPRRCIRFNKVFFDLPHYIF